MSQCNSSAAQVVAVLADRRQDHLRDPVLERLRLRLVGAHDELVEAGLGDEVPGGLALGEHGSDVYLLLDQGAAVLSAALRFVETTKDGGASSPTHEVEAGTHVLRHEPRLVVDGDHPNGVAEAVQCP